MSAYYNLIPQLPALSRAGPPPMSSTAFVKLCETQLSSQDRAVLGFCSLDPDEMSDTQVYLRELRHSGSDFVDDWREWERTLRLNLARYRAQKQKRAASESGAAVEPPAYPASAVSAAKAAAAIESPLEAELFLDEARWNAVESMQGVSYFGENVVFAYLLKLRLLERASLFKAEEGFSEYKALYAEILDNSGDTK